MMNQVVAIGKHKGETLAQVAQFDPTYLDWMRGQGLCGDEVIHARDRGEYKRRVFRGQGEATVWTWD